MRRPSALTAQRDLGAVAPSPRPPARARDRRRRAGPMRRSASPTMARVASRCAGARGAAAGSRRTGRARSADSAARPGPGPAPAIAADLGPGERSLARHAARARRRSPGAVRGTKTVRPSASCPTPSPPAAIRRMRTVSTAPSSGRPRSAELLAPGGVEPGAALRRRRSATGGLPRVRGPRPPPARAATASRRARPPSAAPPAGRAGARGTGCRCRPSRKAGSASRRRWNAWLVATPTITSSSSARPIRAMRVGAVRRPHDELGQQRVVVAG